MTGRPRVSGSSIASMTPQTDDFTDFARARAAFLAAKAMDATARDRFLAELSDREPALVAAVAAMLRLAGVGADLADSGSALEPRGPFEAPILEIGSIIDDVLDRDPCAGFESPPGERSRVSPGANGTLRGGSERVRPDHHTAAHRPLPDLGDRFRPIRPLGAGARGDVFLAHQHAPSRLVAVKVFRDDERSHEPLPATRSSADGSSRAGAADRRADRFTREARILARLSHPGIARVLDVGTTGDGRRYLVMEYVDGEPIDVRSRSRGFDMRTRIDLVLQLCDAVEHAHRRSVIHRDLKPSNVLVTDAAEIGGRSIVKVIDFGIARLLDHEASPDPTLTMHGQLLGTLGYMSPEQLAGQPADTRSDVYAIGVLLHRLLTGRTLGVACGATARAQALRITIGEGGEPRQRREPGDSIDRSGQRCTLPRSKKRDLEAIIGMAVALDAEERYASPLAIAADLRRFLGDRPIVARPTSPVERMRLAFRRSPKLGAAIATVVLLAGIALGAVIHSRSQLAHVRNSQRTEIVRLLDDVLDAMYPLVGAGAPRRALTEQLLSRTDALLALDPDDPQLLEVRARLLLELGKIESETGRLEDAVEIHREAMTAFESLATADLANVPLQRRHAEAIVRHADLLNRAVDVDRAGHEYRRAFTLLQRVAATHPDDIGVLDDLSWAYDRVWNDHDLRRDPDAVLALIDERRGIAERLVRIAPERTLSWFTLMESHRRRSSALATIGRAREALEHADEAIAIGDRLVEAEPHVFHYAIQLGHSLLQAANLAERVGDEARCERNGGRLDEVTAALTEREPLRIEAIELRMFERTWAADRAARQGDPDAVDALVREVLALSERLKHLYGREPVTTTSAHRRWKDHP